MTETGTAPTIRFSVFDGGNPHGFFALSDGATILLRAAARLRASQGRAVVVKLGGSAMEVPAATEGMLDAIAALQTLGVNLILVHGGGKPIDRAMDAAGLKPVKLQGLRYTDEPTLDIVVRVLHEINSGLVAQLAQRGIEVEGVRESIFGERLLLPGIDLQPLDLGRVGKVVRTEAGLFRKNLSRSAVSIVPSLARSEDGGWLNVNADAVAAGIARDLETESVLFLTDTPGVLKDRAKPDSRCPRLTADECLEWMSTGIIDGGMIPKVEACLEALGAGAARAVILDGRDPHSLLNDFLEPGSTGTEIVK